MNFFAHILKSLFRIFTHNRCDTCGWTKDEVHIYQEYAKASIVQCEKCANEGRK